MHGSMRRREATPDQSAQPRGPRTPPADPTKASEWSTISFACRADWELVIGLATEQAFVAIGPDAWNHPKLRVRLRRLVREQPSL